jgi:chemotaxis-related protein WspD
VSQINPPAIGLATAAEANGSAESPPEVSGCWTSRGVYGDGSCPELKTFVHCRNCPVYSAAGALLIDRPLPPNYRQEWTKHFADEKRFFEAGNASAILFRIQNEWLALPTNTFQEVAEKRPIHSLPHRRDGVLLGLANVRGELVTCLSIGHLLQVERMPSLASLRISYRRLLVIHWESSRLAFPVDEVHGPHRFHPQELKGAPSTVARASPRYVQGMLSWQNHTAGVLDTDLLFSSLQRRLG